MEYIYCKMESVSDLWCCFHRNYNYGAAGVALKEDLLNHPEYIEQNATLAFQAAIWRWMTPLKKGQPSAHQAFVGDWKPTKNDTLSNRFPGFGITMNILYGDGVCGKGEVDDMNNIMSHYQHYLDLMGVGAEQAGTNLTCGEQKAFNPSNSGSSSSWVSSNNMLAIVFFFGIDPLHKFIDINKLRVILDVICYLWGGAFFSLLVEYEVASCLSLKWMSGSGLALISTVVFKMCLWCNYVVISNDFWTINVDNYIVFFLIHCLSWLLKVVT